LLQVIPVRVQGDVSPGASLGGLILQALRENGAVLQDGDVLVVAQKIVSKAEGRAVRLSAVRPSARAVRLARRLGKDARLVELILRESKEVVKIRRGIIITETRHGFVCANSAVDQSNLCGGGDDDGGGSALLLPVDPDGSARRLRSLIKKEQGKDIAVVITDTFGRPFREGQVNVAVGVSGLRPIKSYIGKKDMFGKKLRVTEIAVADELASAAELVMGKAEGVPVAIVRGYAYESDGRASSKPLIRKKERDLFR
jgi:coenzyme F420-0:L-glutamate ligase/coenzyme F420-1:gamma-L-glutamate ligase